MQTEHRLQRPNNSFKPSPLRGRGAGSYDSAIAVAATLPGLTQALGLHMEVQEAPTEQTAKQSTETFFPVSTLKLVLMSLSTFGLYQIFWLYQNWRIVKYRERRRISPPWRSVLGLFFLYPILRRIKKQAAVTGFGMLPAGTLFVGWLLLSLLSYAPDPLLAAISFGSVFALVPVQRKANSINRLARPDFPRNDTFGKMNWIALLLGGPIFVLSILGLIVQSVQT